MEIDSIELLPCPFCGSPPTLYHTSRTIYPHVVCSSEACEACGPALYSPEAAIDAWNKRATPPTAGREGEDG